jgi:solute carrier family 32 (vesicular inhibitory amino acid transporter)
MTSSLRPLIEILDETFAEQSANRSSLSNEDRRSRSHAWARAGVRVAVIALVILLAVAIPDFDRVMAIMGSALCCPISILLPALFHTKLLRGQLSWTDRCLNNMLLVVGAGMTIVGTVAALL